MAIWFVLIVPIGIFRRVFRLRKKQQGWKDVSVSTREAATFRDQY